MRFIKVIKSGQVQLYNYIDESDLNKWSPHFYYQNIQ